MNQEQYPNLQLLEYPDVYTNSSFIVDRSRLGWVITRYVSSYKTFTNKVSYTRIINWSLANQIHQVYESHSKVPAKEWLGLIGITPTKGNGAAKAFCYYFKKDYIPNAIKMRNLAYIAKDYGEAFKAIAEDYTEWGLPKKALTWVLIWKFRKESLPGRLPRDLMRVILDMIWS